jgi:hypothetical protein
MIFKILSALFLMVALNSNAAECTLYEKSHPLFPLTGAHLSTGKCSTCASCHNGGVFNGTPKSCTTCHNGDPRWMTVGRPTLHIPTLLIECNSCHTTVSFSTGTNMNHVALNGMKCITCHLRGTNYLGNMERMSLTHYQKTPVPTDCSQVGCHRPGGTKGVLYKSWDN